MLRHVTDISNMLPSSGRFPDNGGSITETSINFYQATRRNIAHYIITLIAMTTRIFHCFTVSQHQSNQHFCTIRTARIYNKILCVLTELHHPLQGLTNSVERTADRNTKGAQVTNSKATLILNAFIVISFFNTAFLENRKFG